MDVVIRSVKIEDTELLWNMMYALDNETKYMMYEPKERKRNLNRLNSVIHEALEGNNFLLVAEAKGEIVGYISAEKGTLKRVQHSAYIVVGIRTAYQNKGIGTLFFEKLDQWAKDKGITRLELTVMCHNHAAKHLYEKHGFIVEGIRKNSMVVDGAYVDEYYMAKLM